MLGDVSDTEEKFLGTKEAASLMGVSVGSIQKWIDQEKVIGWRTTGGHRRVAVKSLLEFAQLNRQKKKTILSSMPLRILTVGLEDEARQSLVVAQQQRGCKCTLHHFDTVIDATIQMCAVMPDLVVVDPKQFLGLHLEGWVRVVLGHESMRRAHMLAICSPVNANLPTHFRLHWMERPVTSEKILEYLNEFIEMRD